MIKDLSVEQTHEEIKNEYAVCIKNAHKHYGSKRKPIVVLQNLNMTVPKGVIYGLLGASGCGKTTLLNCIVGHRQLYSGDIMVLGNNSRNVSSYRIGYMPQEMALVGEFSIRETLMFFGWIVGMTINEIEERTEFLIELFMLPKNDPLVRNLSGGQQRRVSLAVALLHEPELLILDEPTVGLDPILRENIWDYFLSATKECNTTIIITTHYIDEARQAHMIALMRGGYFLAEDSPANLLTRFGFASLEDLFSHLSMIQNTNANQHLPKTSDISGLPDAIVKSKDLCGITNESFAMEKIDFDSVKKHKLLEDSSIASFHSNRRLKVEKSYSVINKDHLKALLWKNLFHIIRSIPLIMLILTMPFLQNAIFCIGIGHDPINLSIAAVDHETNNSRNCQGNITCNTKHLGCHFLKYLEERDLKLMYYDSDEAATESVLKGTAYASVILKHNYSAALRVRLEAREETEPWDFNFSDIDVFRDISNKHIAQYLKIILLRVFKTFVGDYLVSCNSESRWLLPPIKWETPVYGSRYLDFTDFSAPGVLLTCACFLGLASTALTMINERKGGMFDRLLITGVSEIEVLVSHALCQFVVVIIQTIIALVTIFVIFGIGNQGSFVLIVFLTFLSGLFGMCYGLFLSCIFNSEIPAMYAALGSFFPIIMVSGFVWPIEGMHYLLQPISIILPFTQPIEGLRSIMHRGWDLSVGSVYMGFIAIVIWNLILFVFSILIIQFKKR